MELEAVLRLLYPINPSTSKNGKFGSKLVRKHGEFFLHVTVKKKVELRKEYSSIIAVELHKIAKEIVDEAEKHNAIIAIGNLNGVRKKNKGRKVNRKVNSMPSYKLKEYIKYKALERGILVIEVPEYNTSKQCSRWCSMRTERPSQGLFVCLDCGYQINADVNGAKNILKRAQGYMLWAGAAVTQPEGERFLHTLQPPLMASGGSTVCKGGEEVT
ncbi:hypothetical protein DRO30_01735 [Candidatus Bathyarchaeota archaeon]|nr:MAG: hypothetical protein DRO30_01735 [Candidatus Bathyarchaeota archaeon]